MITGESLPVNKNINDKVIGGSVNIDVNIFFINKKGNNSCKGNKYWRRKCIKSYFKIN
jgi:hypothetical protein